MICWYYLHTNGDLIYKTLRPDPSDFVRKIWTINTLERESAWILCVEALALGARKKRIDELVAQWKLTDEDAQTFVDRVGMRLFMDGDKWCATDSDFVNVQESQVGFGTTALEALADYAAQGGLGSAVS